VVAPAKREYGIELSLTTVGPMTYLKSTCLGWPLRLSSRAMNVCSTWR
jgi:hypothetical protein